MNRSFRRPQPSTKQPAGTADIYLWSQTRIGQILAYGQGPEPVPANAVTALSRLITIALSSATRPSNLFLFMTSLSWPPAHGVRSRPDLDYSIVGWRSMVSSIRKSHSGGPVGPAFGAQSEIVAFTHSRGFVAVYTPA
jgi:hypothetical protein